MDRKESASKNSAKPGRQRALVLQGGGALGAFEVGVLKTLYKKLSEEDKKNGEDRLLFDIIAGTSIGAMNGGVLVSQFLKEKERFESEQTTFSPTLSWKKAIDGLERFWKEGIALKEGTSSYHDVPPLKMFSMFSWWAPWTKETPWWNPYTKKKWTDEESYLGKNVNTENLASEEAARRYYSTKVFVAGAKKVFSFKETRDDDKFFDEDNPLAKWVILNDEPLQRQIETFGKFPIATSFDEGEPRLLVTAVDIAEGITVTFDSYKKSDGRRKTVYYSGGKYGYNRYGNNNRSDSKPIIIEYDKGVTIEHVMASGTLPELYDPRDIREDKERGYEGKFWDGGLLSNTPLRELLEAHRDYWVNVEKRDQAPDLEVYIINLHPSRIDLVNIPKKYDEVKDRNNDILYGDRTYSDQYTASLVTDYIDLVTKIKELAINYIKEDSNMKAFQMEFERLKTEDANSTSKTLGEVRKYGDLIKGRFELTKVERIERHYDPCASTSLKTGDITAETIDKLIDEGENWTN